MARKKEDLLASIAGGIAVAAFSVLLSGWIFMLTVGVIHAQWLTSMPTIGFNDAMLIAFLVGFTVRVLAWDWDSE